MSKSKLIIEVSDIPYMLNDQTIVTLKYITPDGRVHTRPLGPIKIIEDPDCPGRCLAEGDWVTLKESDPIPKSHVLYFETGKIKVGFKSSMAKQHFATGNKTTWLSSFEEID